MVKFRFHDLKIWQLAIQIANELFDIADELEKKKLYRFAEQLRGSGMSMSNNTRPVKQLEIKLFYTYVLQSMNDNKFYMGYTTNLKLRFESFFQEHLSMIRLQVFFSLCRIILIKACLVINQNEWPSIPS